MSSKLAMASNKLGSGGAECRRQTKEDDIVRGHSPWAIEHASRAIRLPRPSGPSPHEDVSG